MHGIIAASRLRGRRVEEPPPVIGTLTLKTISTSPTWQLSLQNTGDTLMWEVRGTGISIDVTDDAPIFDLSGNTGEVVITIKNSLGLTRIDSNFAFEITFIDVSECVNLTHLSIPNNLITSLDASNCVVLETIFCYNSLLTSINCPASLTRLACYNNKLTSLDVSDLIVLDNLQCDNNLLTSLDVSDLIVLDNLQCDNNLLTSLDISNNTELTQLRCNQNQITGTDLDQILFDLNDNLFSGDVKIDSGRTSASDQAKADIESRGGYVSGL